MPRSCACSARPKKARSNSTFLGDEGAPTPVSAPAFVPALAPAPDPTPTPAYHSHYYEMLIKRFDQLEARLDTYNQQQQEQHDADMTWFAEQFASIHRYFQSPPPLSDEGPSCD